MQRILAVVIVLCAVPGVAHAGVWYYAWRCSGQCAPNQLAITGVEGPFLTVVDCESARRSDSRGETFIGPGNLGGLDNCEERDPATLGQGAPHPAVFQRLRIGAVGGYGWHVADAAGTDSRAPSTAGVDLAIVFGGHTNFGYEFSVGAERTAPVAPFYGSAAKPMVIYPWRLGLTSSPALWRDKLRLDLAADIIWLYRSCSDCNDTITDGYGASIRTGLDYYFSGDYGVGFAAVFMWASMGNTSDPVEASPVQINAPSVLYHLTFTWRSSRLAW